MAALCGPRGGGSAGPLSSFLGHSKWLVSSLKFFSVASMTQAKRRPNEITTRRKVIVSLLRPAPSPDWAEILAHILRTAHDSLASILLRLAFQVTVYYIWSERNEEDIHNEVDQPISLQNEVYVKR
ncbi:unnamed protein product [Brassica oleracea]